MQHVDQSDFEVGVEPIEAEAEEDSIDWRLAAKVYGVLMVASPLICAAVKWLATGKWPIWITFILSRATT